MWVVHAVVLALILALFARRVYMQRWLPRRWFSSSAQQGRRRWNPHENNPPLPVAGDRDGEPVRAVCAACLFLFFDMVAQLDEIGQRGFRFRDALFYVALTLPSRTYELTPIAALIGTIYTLSKLAANSEFTIMRVSGMSTRRLMKVCSASALIIVALTYVLGEFISPPAEQLAQKVRLQATDSPIGTREFRSGVWVRDVVKDRIRWCLGVPLHQCAARSVPKETRSEWRVFEFDRDYKLRSILTAETGQYAGTEGWTLSNVVETKLPGPTAAASVPQIAAARTEVIQQQRTSMAIRV